MNLHRIEYQIRSTGQNLICLSVGKDENDVIKDIVSVVGEITVLSLYQVSEVPSHFRLTKLITLDNNTSK